MLTAARVAHLLVTDALTSGRERSRTPPHQALLCAGSRCRASGPAAPAVGGGTRSDNPLRSGAGPSEPALGVPSTATGRGEREASRPDQVSIRIHVSAIAVHLVLAAAIEITSRLSGRFLRIPNHQIGGCIRTHVST